MIILLGIFVWAPMMAYLGWKYVQTFEFAQRNRSAKRRTRRALLPAAGGEMFYNESRRRVRRSF